MKQLAVATMVVGLAAVGGVLVHRIDPVIALAATVAAALAFVALRSLNGFLWASLAFKPVVDVFYNQGIGELTLQRVLAVVAPVVGIIVLVASGTNVLVFPMITPIVAFTVVNFLGAILSIDTVEGVQIFFRVAGPLVFYFLAERILPDDAAARRMLTLVALFAGVSYVWALLQLTGILPTPIIPLVRGLEGIRLTGPYTHPWDLVRFLVLTIPFSLMRITESRGSERVFWWIYLTGSLIVVAYTNLKYAQMAIFLQVVIWFVLTRQYVKVAAAFAAAGAFVMANFSFLNGLYADVTELFGATDIASAAGGMSGRVGVWDKYLTQFWEMPVVYQLFGTGFDYARIIGVASGINQDPHNDLVRILVSNGYVGIAVYLWLLVAIGVFLVRSVRILRATGDGFRLRLCYVTVCVYLGYIAAHVSARPSQYPSLTWYMWLLLGLMVAWTTDVREKGDTGA